MPSPDATDQQHAAARLCAPLQRLDMAQDQRAQLMQQIQTQLHKHGDVDKWLAAVKEIPVSPGHTQLDSAAVHWRGDLSEAQHNKLISGLHDLHPWRKGPFQINDTLIDSEWNCALKWSRLAPHLDLQDARVLDIGCGNGYYGWRMLGAGAQEVLGVDPSLQFAMQYLALDRLICDPRFQYLPLRSEALSPQPEFDFVFSMGVLYHRRSPIDHLTELRSWLRSGGTAILETLVVDGDEHTVLTPPDRYARMRNVWFIPSSALLLRWLRRAGFAQVELLDESITTVEEQRSTAWMQFESLQHALNPDDHTRTIEDLPAPKRAIVRASIR